MTDMARDDLITEMVAYPDGEIFTGYLARSADEEPGPAVLVVQEWWGLNEHIKDVARRLAREGFVALAPDLYHGQVVSEPDEARKLAMELEMADAVQEIQSAVDFLQGQNYVTQREVGVVGFCMGGRLVLHAARVEDDLAAAVAFYGTPLTPEEVGEMKAPLLGLYGSEDHGIPVEDVRVMEEALRQVGIENEIRVYDGAGHAFFNDTRESYDPDAATDAWPRTLTWFRDHLGA